MKGIKGFAVCMMVVVVGISLIGVGIARARIVVSTFTRDLRLANQSKSLVRENVGNLRLYSLALPMPGETLSYDRVLAQKEALKLSTPQTTALLAKH